MSIPETISPESRPVFAAGQTLAGCYTLRRPFSTKGEGTAWLAWDEVMQTEVELEFIPAAVFADRSAMEKLGAQIQRSRGLVHPNALRIFDLVEEPVWAALVQESAEGVSLRSLQEHRPGGFFEAADLRGIVTQLCEVLEAGHRLGLVHGRVRPDNLRVTADGELKLGGFGLAAILDRSNGAAPASQNGGTPGGKSAEQPQPVDDIHGVGALLFELLTGSMPVALKNSSRGQQSAVVPSITARRAELKLKAEPLPEGWDAAVVQALSGERGARFQTVADLAIALGLRAGGADGNSAIAAAVADDLAKAEPVPESSAAVDAVATPSAPSAPEKTSVESVPRPEPPAPPAPAKKPDPGPVLVPSSDPFLDRARPPTRFPFAGMAVALILLAIGVAGYLLTRSSKPQERRDDAAISAPTPRIAPVASPQPSVASRPLPVQPPIANGTPAATPTAPEVDPARLAAERDRLEKELADAQRLAADREHDLELQQQAAASTSPSAAPSDSSGPSPSAMPSPSAAESASPIPVRSGIAKTLENTLGMHFAPVGDLLFCIWPTRVSDYEVFVKSSNYKGGVRQKTGFTQGLDHPAVYVSWNDAMAFCKWLTEKERREGLLTSEQFYRLPTDLEWSHAVGLPEEKGATPETRDMGIAGVYPWGTQWPPPHGAGNYTGEETGSDVAIHGYDDGFVWTSPVGSFAANSFGLYDMGGNVWEWCMDSWNKDSTGKVLRGASWYNGALKLSLLSSCRYQASPDSSTDNYGFRCVLVTPKAASTP